MKYLFWWVYVKTIQLIFGDKYDKNMLIKYSDNSNFRKVFGGNWSYWELDTKYSIFTSSNIWIHSDCEHFPKPPLAIYEKPCVIEKY